MLAPSHQAQSAVKAGRIARCEQLFWVRSLARATERGWHREIHVDSLVRRRDVPVAAITRGKGFGCVEDLVWHGGSPRGVACGAPACGGQAPPHRTAVMTLALGATQTTPVRFRVRVIAERFPARSAAADTCRWPRRVARAGRRFPLAREMNIFP